MSPGQAGWMLIMNSVLLWAAEKLIRFIIFIFSIPPTSAAQRKSILFVFPNSCRSRSVLSVCYRSHQCGRFQFCQSDRLQGDGMWSDVSRYLDILGPAVTALSLLLVVICYLSRLISSDAHSLTCINTFLPTRWVIYSLITLRLLLYCFHQVTVKSVHSRHNRGVRSHF